MTWVFGLSSVNKGGIGWSEDHDFTQEGPGIIVDCVCKFHSERTTVLCSP